MLEWESSTPVVIEKGVGSTLIDTEGKRYIDAFSSLWVNVHGHNKREINASIKKQLDKIAHSTLLGYSNVPSIELAKRLVKIAPKGLTKVFYSDNGSTAVEIALKMAFYAGVKSGRTKFIAFTGAYHGDTVGSMSVGEIDEFVGRYKPLMFDSFRAPYPHCYRCILKKEYPSCKLACVAEFEKILKKHGKKIAACVIEPLIQGAAGMVTSPPGFLKEIRRLTKKYGVLLIADEVATGFGRTGRMFACEHEDVRPDFLCLAKGLTGGYLPLAATLTTEAIYKTFLGTKESPDAFYHGHTYTGNQLGCAAAIASLDIFKKEQTIKKLTPKIKLLKDGLAAFNGMAHVGNVRQCGMMAAIELVKDKKTKQPFPARLRVARRVCSEAEKMGVIIRPINDTIIIIPPLSIKAAELKTILSVLHKSIKKVLHRHDMYGQRTP